MPLHEKMRMKRALLDHGIQTAGMSDEQIAIAYAALLTIVEVINAEN